MALRQQNDFASALVDAFRVTGPESSNWESLMEWLRERWQPGATLEKIDPAAPWGPDNAYMEGGIDPDGWNEIWGRYYHQIPEVRVEPCKRCKVKDTCARWCPKRARWWDAQMKKLRKALCKYGNKH